MASVAPLDANVARRSLTGIAEARPGMRVKTTLCAMPGTVNSRPRTAAELLGQRTVNRQVPRMKPRHIEARSMGIYVFALDLIEGHCRAVDEACPRRTVREQVGRHQRAGVQTHGASREDVAAADGDEIGGPGAGADEMYRHVRSPSARAQVTGPTATLGASNRAFGPAAANAAASATECTFSVSMDRAERVNVRASAASNAFCAISTSGTPRAAAAATMPDSAPFTAGTAIRPSRWAASRLCSNAASMADSTCAAEIALRQPTPATITASPKSIA